MTDTDQTKPQEQDVEDVQQGVAVAPAQHDGQGQGHVLDAPRLHDGPQPEGEADEDSADER